MDLGLIRKRIVARNIQTLADLHGAVALISHNCVKYNGRESDYGRVAVEFEAMADHVILQAVNQQQQQQLVPTQGGEAGVPAVANAVQLPAATTKAKGTKAKGSKVSKASAPQQQNV